ncbi:MAG TPA: glutathione S-transferase N-terminal domain-containing protein, partial [Burkholderiaceae bacterium]
MSASGIIAGVIELLQFPPAFGLPNGSPFCMKVEVFLRLAGLEYRTVTASPLPAPKGKLPVLRDGGRTIADSEAIVRHLQATYADRIPAALAAPETARELLVRRTIEEHLYFAALRFRWVDDAGARHS